MIVLKQVSKTYRQGGVARSVLHSVSLEVNAGEFVAIQGPSGSGKSTLLNLIAGIDSADSGHIEIEGQLMGALNEHQRTLFRRRHIGFVFQFFSLIPTLTVAENIGFSLELNRLEVELEARVAELLDQIGLADRAHSYPDQLSGGEQQRVAVARAIAHRPTLVLADEPTGNLDVDNEAIVMDLLAGLQKQGDATLLVATHSDEVAVRADRVLPLVSLGGRQ